MEARVSLVVESMATPGATRGMVFWVAVRELKICCLIGCGFPFKVLLRIGAVNVGFRAKVS